jgi:hypothetical protein
MRRIARYFKDNWLGLLLTAAVIGPVAWFGAADILSAQPVNSNTLTVTDAPSSSPPTLGASGLDTNIGIRILPKGTGIVTFPGSGGATITGPLTVNGVFTAAGGQSFGNITQQLFLNGPDNCYADNTATPMIRVRLATGDWALARTAAGAETQNIECAISLPSQITALKGFRVDSFSLVHQITVVNLTSGTFQQLSTTAYANAVANAVTQYGGAPTITMPTVVQATPYVTAATLAAPAFQNAANTQVLIDWQVVMANTGVYRVYGVIVNFTGTLY